MKELEQIWYEEEKEKFQGWDFSHLKNRWNAQELSWDYDSIVKAAISPTKKIMEIGTGGGEFLLSLNHPYENTAATESWEPNILLCKERLEPLGIDFCPVANSNHIGLPSNYFDIIIDRHSEYSVKEIARMLKPNGLFITQQVGDKNCKSLRQKVNREKIEIMPFSLETEIEKFLQEGFEVIQAEEEYPILTFEDVGAIVYFAKRIIWSFPDFSVDQNKQQLWALQKELEVEGNIKTEEHRFLIVAQKK